MIFKKTLNILVIPFVCCSFLHSCFLMPVFVIKEKIKRQSDSMFRFSGMDGNNQGKIRTDGIYVYEQFANNPKDGYRFLHSMAIPPTQVKSMNCLKFYNDGTIFYLTLRGNEFETLKPYLEGFELTEIESTFGVFSVSDNNTIYVESYSRPDAISPKKVTNMAYYIVNDTVLLDYTNQNFHRIIFVPCDIPITSHHPFKSKRWLWTDKKARKQYMREWKKVKKERRKSKIKYSYE